MGAGILLPMDVYQALLLVFFVLFLAIRKVFERRVRTAQTIESRHERRERGFYLLVAFTYLLIPVWALTGWLDPAAFDSPDWLRWVGVGVLAAGLATFWWTHRTLGRNWSGVLEIYENHTLVRDGPYRLVRHPMYTAFLVCGIGILLTSSNAILGPANLLAVTVMLVVRIPAEERMLIEHFEDEYRKRMRTTGRLLPRLR